MALKTRYIKGATIGNLIITEITTTGYLCNCLCGKTNVSISVNCMRATRPKIKSCGCLHPKKIKGVEFKNIKYGHYFETDITREMVNKQFGKLLVLGVLGKIKTAVFYHAVCSCGSEVSVTRAPLVTGDTVSCGCLSRDRAQERYDKTREIIAGTLTKSGYWRFLSFDKQKGRWLCECTECGNKKHFIMYQAEKAKCQCRRRRISELSNFVGSTNGWLTVLELSVPDKGVTKFKCVCKCGNIEEYPAYYIENNRRSCCSSCSVEYKSLYYGGTGIPGETRALGAYMRDCPKNREWMRKIYSMYGTICQVTGEAFKDSSFLRIHHLNAAANILPRSTSVSQFNLMSSEEQKEIERVFYDTSNGIPLDKEIHIQLHTEVSKTPSKEESLEWINKKRKIYGLLPLEWCTIQNKYV